MKPSTFCKAITASAMFAASLLFTACNSETHVIRFGSGNEGGLYHNFANKLSEIFSKSDASAQFQVKSTAGTSANIRLLEEGFLDIAIVQADILNDFLMTSRSRHAIAAVSGLYTESIQIVVATESEIKTIEDLAGKKVSVGEEESGVLRNAEIILEAHGIPMEKIQKKNLSFSEATKALAANEIDAFFCTAGIPTPSIAALAGQKDIRIISLDSAAMERITNLHPELTTSEIPASTYAKQDSVVHTLGAKAVLVASQLLDSASVTNILGTVFANAELKPSSLDFATTNIPVGFHPGAASFFAKQGINVEVAAPLQGRGPIPSTGD